MKKIISFGIVLGSAPLFAFAADAFSIITVVNKILATIIPVLITLAVVYFIWGVIQYTVSTDEEAKKGAREEFFYFSDDGDLTGLRYDNWKFVFMEQRAPGTLRVWSEPYTALRIPKLFNLRTDPYERADITSNTYYDWFFC